MQNELQSFMQVADKTTISDTLDLRYDPVFA